MTSTNKIVYVDGVFDMFHKGHINFLYQAKLLGTTLIVGVVTDTDVNSYKRMPIISYENRVAVLKELRMVDQVVEAQLILDNDFIKKYNIDLVAHGDDAKQEQFFKIPIEMGIMRYVKYTQTISTSKIIQRCKNLET